MKWDLALKQFDGYLRLERGMSPNTVAAYVRDVEALARWAVPRDRTAANVTSDELRAAVREMAEGGINARSQARRLSAWRAFFGFVREEGLREDQPALGVDQPSLAKPLPTYLTEDEVERLFAAIDRSKPFAERDVAVLEVLYGCGLRVSELVELRLRDVFADDAVIRVVGKGDKERLVPIHDAALRAIARYRTTERCHIEPQRGFEDHVFLNRNGRKVSRQWVFLRLKAWAMEAGITKVIGPHTLRHTFATHLLQNGVDLRFIQVMMGHSSITNTEIYAHLEGRQLRETMLRYHPRNVDRPRSGS
ncbi:MAG: tyrosine recombinase [Schleiferiaceae bacterium]